MSKETNTDNPLIIEDPSLQTLGQRYGWNTITFFFWVLYIYLWLPVLALLAWLFGYDRFVNYFLATTQPLNTSSGIGLYFLIIIAIAVIFIGWAKIERARFYGKVRRSSSAPVNVDNMAAHWSLDAATLANAQQQKRMIIEFDEDTQIKAIHH